MKQLMIVAGRGALRGVRSVVRVFVKVCRIRRVRGSVRFAEVISGATSREVVHPRGEAAVVAVGVPIFQHPLKHGLHDVFRGGPVARELHEKAEERPVVSLEEFAQRIELAIANGEHQRVIGASVD